VPGQHQGHHLVAQLPIGHPLAGLGVAGLDQHGEQIGAGDAVLAAALDGVQHHVVERAQGRLESPVGGSGNHARHREERVDGVHRVAQHHGQRAADGGGDGGEVLAEERAPQDLQGDAQELGHQVDHLAPPRQRAPAIDELGGGLAHGAAEGGQPLLVEGRLGDAPLAPPEIAIGGEQPIAQRGAQHLERVGLPAVVLAVVLENALHPARLRDDVPIEARQPDLRHRSIRLRGLHQEAERIGAKLGERADERPPGRAGRDAADRERRSGGGHGRQL
jgi:hypothetical protein